MYRPVLFAIAIFATSVASAQEVPTQLTAREWSTQPGITHVEQLRAGTMLDLCRTAATMDVVSIGKNVIVKGGRLCKHHQPPTVALDPSTCVVHRGPDAVFVTTNCAVRY